MFKNRRNLNSERRMARLNRIGQAPDKPQAKNPVENLVVELNTNIQEKEEMSMEKLILDQPNRVTLKGTVEAVVVSNNLPLNETPIDTTKKNEEILINEDPMDGIQIILND